MRKIRVLIVDDSALVRKLLTQVINNEPDMQVIGTAPNPFIARDKIVKFRPDVMTLDIEMPRMDGLTFLDKLMHHMPLPTVIVSSVTAEGCATSLKALEIGAVEVIPKPDAAYSIAAIEERLVLAIRSAAQACVRKRVKEETPEPGINKPLAIPTTNKLIAIGASTGGTEAIKQVIKTFPPNIPATLIVQHMPPNFTKAFTRRLDSICAAHVKEAEQDEPLQPGKILVAPGNYHLQLRRDGASYYVKLKQGPQVWHQRPAIDVLFSSVAEYASNNAIGVILTGMGKDGAAGMLKMKNAGAINIAQDEASSVVFGMPKAAIDANCVDYVEDLNAIPNRIIKCLKKLSQ